MLKTISITEIRAETVAALETGRYEQGLHRCAFFWDYRNPFLQPDRTEFSKHKTASLLLFCGQLYGMYGVSLKNAQEISKNFLYEAFSMFKKFGDTESQISASNHLALAYQRMGDFGEARIWVDTSFELGFSDGDPAQLHAYLIETLIDTSDKKYDKALSRLESLEDFFTNSKYSYLSAMYYNQVGIAKRNLGKLNGALKAFTLAHELYTQLGHLQYITHLENNMACLYRSKKNIPDAYRWAERALSSALSSRDARLIGGVYDTLAGIAFDDKNYEFALSNAEQAILEVKQTECYANLLDYYETKIMILLAFGRVDSALDTLIDAGSLEQFQATGVCEGLKKLIIEYIHNNYRVQISRAGNHVAARDECYLKLERGFKLSAPVVELVEIFNNSQKIYGLEKGSFAVVEKSHPKNGEFAAIKRTLTNIRYLGFVDSILDFIYLQENLSDNNPISFSADEVEIIGRVIGCCSGEADADGFLHVVPLLVN
jgi:hypothetical protein